MNVNINKASTKDLEKIVNIGPKRAVAIQENRPFKDLYELSKVPQIGKKRMEAILKEGIAVV